MNVYQWILGKFGRRTPQEAITMLALSAQMHAREIEAVREQTRLDVTAEFRQKVRDELMRVESAPGMSAPWLIDKARIDVGLLFSETSEDREEWVAYVKDHRVAEQDRAYNELHRRIHGMPGRV
jgi:hypothetical protein